MFLSSSLFKHLTIGYLEEGGLYWLTVFRGTVYCVRNRVTSRCLFGIGSREGAGNMAGELISRLETGNNTFIHTHICLLDKSIAGPQPLCTSSYPKLHLQGFLPICILLSSSSDALLPSLGCKSSGHCILVSFAPHVFFFHWLPFPSCYFCSILWVIANKQETLGEPVVFLWWDKDTRSHWVEFFSRWVCEGTLGQKDVTDFGEESNLLSCHGRS